MSKYSSLPDAELVRHCREGDADAWNELVERFSRYVYAIAVRGFRLSDEDAEDVFQDVFTRIYTRLDSLRDDSALRPWIAQLTRRRCLDVIAAKRELPADEAMAEDGSSDLSDIEEAFEVREALGNCRARARTSSTAFSHATRATRRSPTSSRFRREPSPAASRDASESCDRSSREEMTQKTGLGVR